MSGTGSFMKNTKSKSFYLEYFLIVLALYVGGIRLVPKVEEVIYQAFAAFGTITYCTCFREIIC